MSLDQLTFGEFVVLILVIIEVIVVFSTLIVLAVLRRRAIHRETTYERVRRHLAEGLNDLLDDTETEFDRQALAQLRALSADNARRLLTELAEYVEVEQTGGLRRLYAASGLVEVSRAASRRRPWERLRVVREARALGDPAGLLEALVRDDVPEVRLAAHEALCSIGRAADGLESLRRIAEDGRLSRLRAVEALAETDPLPAEELKALAHSDSAALREVIVGALGRAHAQAGISTLIEAVTDEEVEVRIQALRGLEGLGDAAALPACIGALQDEFWEVRSAAVRACAALGGPGVAEHLARTLDDEAEWVRHNGALALARCGPGGLAVLRAAAARGNESASSALAEHRLAVEGA